MCVTGAGQCVLRSFLGRHGRRAADDNVAEHRPPAGHEVVLVRVIQGPQDVSLDGLAQRAAELAGQGRTPVLVAIDRRAAGVIAIADAPRQTSTDAIAALAELGVRAVMLTGDSRPRRSASPPRSASTK